MPEFPKEDALGAMASRILRTAGYVVDDFQQTGSLVEIHCRLSSRLGCEIAYYFAFTTANEFSEVEIEDIRRAAGVQRLPVVLVAAAGGVGRIGWSEFTRLLGGEVPSWRALQPAYGEALVLASKGEVPSGEEGEAWFLFEELVADGLEFVLGRRVIRKGGRRRGLRVSDMLAQLPAYELLVVDAKAYKSGFDASYSNLRALAEYVLDTAKAQNGNSVIGALVVSSKFRQDAKALEEISKEFFGYCRVPVTFLTADSLVKIVSELKELPTYRGSVNWRQLFSGGLLDAKTFTKALKRVELMRVDAQEK